MAVVVETHPQERQGPAAEALAMQGARASVAILLTQFSQNIRAPAT